MTSERPLSPPNPAVVVVSGIPGAGKTTVARQLAECLERAAYIEADAVQAMIVEGGVWPDGAGLSPGGTPQGEGLAQLGLRGRNVCLLANSFAEAGFTAVIDDVVVGSRLEEFRRQLRAQPVWFVLLVPSIHAVEERNRGRGSDEVFRRWSYLDERMRAETPRVGLRLDSSRLTVEETVVAILDDAGETARIA